MPPKERKAEDIDDPEDLQGIIDLMDIVEVRAHTNAIIQSLLTL